MQLANTMAEGSPFQGMEIGALDACVVMLRLYNLLYTVAGPRKRDIGAHLSFKAEERASNLIAPFSSEDSSYSLVPFLFPERKLDFEVLWSHNIALNRNLHSNDEGASPSTSEIKTCARRYVFHILNPSLFPRMLARLLARFKDMFEYKHRRNALLVTEESCCYIAVRSYKIA